jgi:hypothetical protein
VSAAVMSYQCQGPYGRDFGAKDVGKGKDWHPGVMGHKYRADSFSYALMEVMKEALTEVTLTQGRGRKSLKELHEEAHHYLNRHLFKSNFSAVKNSDHHHTELPKPMACDPSMCKRNPVCYTEYEPRWAANKNLGSMVVGSSAVPQGWSREISWLDVAGVSKAKAENRGYKDLKYIYISTITGEGPLQDADGGVLTLDITTQTNRSVWLCQVQRGFAKYSGDKGELNQAAEVSINMHMPKSVKRELPFTGAKSGKW